MIFHAIGISLVKLCAIRYIVIASSERAIVKIYNIELGSAE